MRTPVSLRARAQVHALRLSGPYTTDAVATCVVAVSAAAAAVAALTRAFATTADAAVDPTCDVADPTYTVAALTYAVVAAAATLASPTYVVSRKTVTWRRGSERCDGEPRRRWRRGWRWPRWRGGR